MNYKNFKGQRSIHTPRYHFNAVENNQALREMDNRQTNTVLTLGDYRVSIAMDSSHGKGDLFRTDIRVFKKACEKDEYFSEDVTQHFAVIVAEKMGYENISNVINDPVELSIILNHIIKELTQN